MPHLLQCERGHPLNGHPRGPVALTPVLLPSVKQLNSPYLFLRIRSVATAEQPPHARQILYQLNHCFGFSVISNDISSWFFCICLVDDKVSSLIAAYRFRLVVNSNHQLKIF